MANETTWTLRVVDETTVPARAAKQAVAGVTQGVTELDKATRAMQRGAGASLRGLSGGFNGAGRGAAEAARAASSGWQRTFRDLQEGANVFRQIGGFAMSVAGTIGSIGSAVGSLVYQLGRSVLEMIRFREASITTLGVLGGGQGEGIGRIGSAAYQQATAIARTTPTDQRTAVELQQQTFTGGFQGAAQQRALAAALDAGALNANDSTASRRFLIGLSQMRGSARLSEQDLRQTSEAAGIDRSQAMRRAAEAAGIRQNTGESDLSYQRRIDTARRQGRITGAHGVQGVEAQIQATTHRQLGGFARDQGSTLSGSISNVQSAVFELVTSINGLERLPGVVRFKNLLNQVAETLNGSNKAGQTLQKTVREVINGAFGALGSIDPAAIVAGLQRFVGFVQTAVPYVLAFGRGLMTGVRPAFTALAAAVPIVAGFFASLGGGGGAGFTAFLALAGRGLGMMVAMVAGLTVALVGGSAALFGMMTALAGFIAATFGALGTAASQLFTSMYGLASSLVDGFVTGLREQWGRLTGELTTLAQALPGPVRRALGIASPSRVFAEIGRHVAGGMALGIDSGAGQVQAAMGALASPPAVRVSTPRTGPLVGSVTVQVTTGGGNGEEIGESVRSALFELFTDLMDQAALAGGS